jgi:hypothetical protein
MHRLAGAETKPTTQSVPKRDPPPNPSSGQRSSRTRHSIGAKANPANRSPLKRDASSQSTPGESIPDSAQAGPSLDRRSNAARWRIDIGQIHRSVGAQARSAYRLPLKQDPPPARLRVNPFLPALKRDPSLDRRSNAARWRIDTGQIHRSVGAQARSAYRLPLKQDPSSRSHQANPSPHQRSSGTRHSIGAQARPVTRSTSGEPVASNQCRSAACRLIAPKRGLPVQAFRRSSPEASPPCPDTEEVPC